MPDPPPPPPTFASAVASARCLVQQRTLLLVVGRWSRLSYRTLYWGYQQNYLQRYSARTVDPRIIQLLGQVLAGILVPADWEDYIELNQSIRLALEDLPDFAATRILAFVGRGPQDHHTTVPAHRGGAT